MRLLMRQLTRAAMDDVDKERCSIMRKIWEWQWDESKWARCKTKRRDWRRKDGWLWLKGDVCGIVWIFGRALYASPMYGIGGNKGDVNIKAVGSLSDIQIAGQLEGHYGPTLMYSTSLHGIYACRNAWMHDCIYVYTLCQFILCYYESVVCNCLVWQYDLGGEHRGA